ncbi:ATP-dependent Clp protease proteolytic subunit [Hymenobacter busanensis]|uniref:ATP-dependent Clp protease proteolytic subunit n=1 Tax=Hymenobacter busanensis TaxID=2607656 RepID=A0A7L4ZTG0_9BACT|nr:ATP-dependent Clp protease proteolytic subunit [Hymenobacter busanensis]KAA9327440.1 ATP-dependent Clp protease proteolytic subunit [Hymenobacter busanensis]QHJ06223.1 ATP-dependent Clp protease proteolytic subunit [Hymenobacter busanensis]
MLNKQEFRKFAVKGQGLSGLGVDQYLHHIDGQASHYVTGMTRSVIEERPTRFAEIDVFSRLIMDRIVFLGAAVDDNIANIINAQLLFLESADAKKDILLYINSPGGSVYAGLGIYDTMQYVGPDVATICTGLAASMGAVLLAGGAENKRSALPHARVMMHQPSGGVQGASADIEITAREILKLRQELYEILSRHTGKTYEEIHQHSDRDYWLRADEAKAYGLIDEVLDPKAK